MIILSLQFDYVFISICVDSRRNLYFMILLALHGEFFFFFTAFNYVQLYATILIIIVNLICFELAHTKETWWIKVSNTFSTMNSDGNTNHLKH